MRRKRLTDASYKGVKIKFWYDTPNRVVAEAYAIGVVGFGKTKRLAYLNAQPKIDLMKRRGNI